MMEYGILIIIEYIRWHVVKAAPYVLGAAVCVAAGYFLRGFM
jgi:hypothetical protein